MSRLKKFIRIGSQVALLSDFKFKVGAVLTRGNKIISVAPCSCKTSTLQKYSNSFKCFEVPLDEVSCKLHAEVNCLQKLSVREDYSNCDIYIVRIKRKTSNSNEYIFGNSKPCQGCSQLLKKFGVRNAIYYEESVGWVKKQVKKLQ